MWRSPKVAEVLPVLYLRGLSTGDFREALPILRGKDAAGLSPTNIARLTAVWEEEYHAFRQRDLVERDYVYVWVDGVHFLFRDAHWPSPARSKRASNACNALSVSPTPSVIRRCRSASVRSILG